MNEKYAFPEQDSRIVYVKAVDVADLPSEVQAEVEGRTVERGGPPPPGGPGRGPPPRGR